MHFVTIYFTLLFSTLVTLSEADMEYILKPIGNLYFSDTQYTLKFDLNLDAYYSNAQLLNHNTIKLKEKCELINNSLLHDCIFFQDHLKNVADMAIKEMNYVKTNVKSNRQKRELITASLIILGTTIFSIIAGFFAGMAVATATQKELSEQSNIQHNITPKQFDIDEKLAKITNESINLFAIELQHLTDAQYINRLLLSSLFILEKHHRDTIKFFNILNDDIRSKIFNIIDTVTFQETIQNINELKNSPIFSLKPHEIIKMSLLSTELLNNTIRINVHIPLTSKEKFELYSFTPIPIERDHNSFILNSDSKLFFQNNTMFMEIPIATLIQCSQISQLTICDEIFLFKSIPLNNCLNAMVNNQSTNALCTYKPLPHKNQIIKISEDFLYIYVTIPMSLKISCGDNIKKYNLTQSSEINYGKYCKLSTKIDNFLQNESFSIINIESNFIEPNFQILQNSTWEKAEFLNQHNNRVQKLIHDIKITRDYFKKNSKIIKISDYDFFSIIPNFLFDSLIFFILIYILLPIIIILLFICCICRHTK